MSVSKNKKRVILGLLLVVVLVVLGVGLWRGQSGNAGGTSASSNNSTSGAEAGGKGARAGAKAAPLVSVSVVPVVLRDLALTTSASAQVVSLKTVDIRPANLNTIVKVHVKQGQTVKAGQLLFTLDKRADQILLEKAQAQLNKDKASWLELQRQKKRNSELLTQGFVSQAQVDALDTQIAVAQATIDADQAAVKSAQLTLENDEIRAPFAGRLGAINVSEGAQVQPSATGLPLVTLSRIDPIEVQFSLPEKNLYNLRDLFAEKAPVQIVLANQKLTNGTIQTQSFNGRVSFVNNRIDPQTGLILVYAQVANPHQALWPGQYANVNLSLGTLKNALVIPSNALLMRDGAQNKADVYVVDKDNVVEKVALNSVQIFDDLAVVKDLKAGDKVVVEGRQNLRPQQKVQVNP